MNELKTRLFALLRSIICGEELDKSRFENLNEVELEQLYLLAKQHDVAHLVGAALEKNKLLPSDSPISEEFAKQQLLAVYRCENLNYELDRICAALDKAGIAYIPLKGSVVRALYPEPWMRTSCDIDILVHEEKLDSAVDVLVDTLGYTTDRERAYHDVSLFSKSGIHLELHFHIKENIPLLDGVLSRVWEYAAPVAGCSCRHALKNEFLIYQAIAHASYHFVGGGCGIRPFIDLWLMRRSLAFNEEELMALCRESETETFYLEACRFADTVLGEEQGSILTERLENYVLSGGVYGTLEAHIAARQGVRGGKRGYAASRVFASYDDLKTRYPSLKSPALVPVYQVRRWIDTVKNGRLKKSMNELRQNERLDEIKIRSIDALMTELKLNNHIK